ncbi:MAG TPA: exodeoxyribonuclease VII large subunit [Dissulfurispiraceae bacterium]
MEEETPGTRQAYSLYELNTLIKSALHRAFPEAYWVTAEIAECKCNQRGHCYLELVEKADDKTVAQVKANIWAYEYRKLSQKFQAASGETLNPGMKIMLLVSVTFHEVYGLSLNVKDIDPTYTLGEMARKRKEIIERLRKEGIMDLNKSLSLPLVPQKIAVISSPTAAGYGDFFDQLGGNPYGYAFAHVLFPALMQGQEAEKSILAALERIGRCAHLFDVAVIIRGGGSVVDLSCFDSYALASCIARFPIPVITGIGHEKDDTIADMVAHTRMKTPTAVAEFLISGLMSFEETLMDIRDRVRTRVERALKDEHYRLHAVARRLAFVPAVVASLHNRLIALRGDLKGHVRQLIQKEDGRLGRMEQAVKLLDPENVLRRGYSITRCNGKVLKDASKVKKGAVLATRLHKGTVTSIAGQKEEVKESEQGKTAYLLPGFE